MRAIAERHGPEAVAFTVTTPAGTAVSDGFPWINRLIRAVRQPQHGVGRGGVRLAPRLRHDVHLRRRHRHAGLRAHRLPAALGPQPGEHVPGPGHRGRGGEGARRRRWSWWTRGAPGRPARADQWLRVRPGTDGALALGLAVGHDRRGLVRSRRSSATGPTARSWCATIPAGFSPRPISTPAARPTHHVAWDRRAPARCLRSRRPAATSSASTIRCCPAPSRCADARRPSRLPARVRGYAALCRDYPPERVERITGVPAAQIVETARLLWERRPVAYFHWTGLEQHTNASQTVRALSLLYALTGCWDAPGGNVRPTRPADQRPGAALAALRASSARRRSASPSGRSGPPATAGRPGADLYRAILHGTPYPVRGMVGFGANLLLSQPDARVARAALHRLDFLVYADLFLTPTAALADVVLPVVHGVGARGPARGLRPHAGGRALRAAAPRGRRAASARRARTPGSSASWPGAWASAIASSTATRTPGTASCSSRRASRSSSSARAARGRARCRSSRASSATPRRGPDGRSAGFATPSRRVEIFSGALARASGRPAARLRRARREPGEPARPGRALPAPSHLAPRSCSSATASIAACRACGGTAPIRRSRCTPRPRRPAASRPTTGW